MCWTHKKFSYAHNSENLKLMYQLQDSSQLNSKHNSIVLYCHLIVTLKKEAISKQFYKFEYVTWPHEAKTYVNSILIKVFKIYHTSV